MAHHLQCKLPAETEWTTLATSDHKDWGAAREYLSGMRYRYERQSVLDPTTMFRIVGDHEIAREGALQREASGAVSLVALVLFLGCVELWARLLS